MQSCDAGARCSSASSKSQTFIFLYGKEFKLKRCVNHANIWHAPTRRMLHWQYAYYRNVCSVRVHRGLLRLSNTRRIQCPTGELYCPNSRWPPNCPDTASRRCRACGPSTYAWTRTSMCSRLWSYGRPMPTQYACHQSRRHWQPPDGPSEPASCWCRSARTCPTRRSTCLSNTWPSHHPWSANARPLRCADSGLWRFHLSWCPKRARTNHSILWRLCSDRTADTVRSPHAQIGSERTRASSCPIFWLCCHAGRSLSYRCRTANSTRPCCSPSGNVFSWYRRRRRANSARFAKNPKNAHVQCSITKKKLGSFLVKKA